MRLLICRHGETVANARAEIQGHRPGQLSEKGIEQARKLAARLASEQVSIALASDLKRARDTAEEVLRHHTCVLTVHEDLRERAWGELEGQSFKDLFGHSGRPRGEEWLKFVPPGGESLADLRVRAERFVEKALRPIARQETVLITAHHSINKMLMMVLCGWPLQDWENLEQGNTCVNQLEGEFDSGFRATILNCTKHLL